MPYIKEADRERLHQGAMPATPGELNYMITFLIRTYMENTGGLSYTKANEIVGVLDCAKMEFYRRVVFPYEQQKQYENGDVYA